MLDGLHQEFHVVGVCGTPFEDPASETPFFGDRVSCVIPFCIWAASCHDVSAMLLKSSPALKSVICSCLSSSAMTRESQAYVASLPFLRRVMPLAVRLMLIWRPSVGRPLRSTSPIFS